jgi:hypothetical protein
MAINGFAVNGAVINGTGEPIVLESTEVAGSYELYTCVLTGSPDLALPVRNIQARKNNGSPTYGAVTVPAGSDYIDEINARSSGQLVITRTQINPDGTQSGSEILRVDLEDINLSEGSRQSSVVLSGHRTVSVGSPRVKPLAGVSYINTTNGLRRIRAKVDPDLEAGDYAEVDGEQILTETVTYNISERGSTMEIAEQS